VTGVQTCALPIWFILQRLSGDGLAFMHAGGTIIRKDLKPGETLRVDTGALVAMTPSIDYSIKFVGGFTNALFGGEGLFVAALERPGTRMAATPAILAPCGPYCGCFAKGSQPRVNLAAF